MDLRMEKLKKNLNSDEAVIISADPNRLYYTGFRSSAGYLVITKNRQVFFIDFRYFEKASKTVKHLEVVLLNKLSVQLTEFLKFENIKTVYLETDTVSLSEYNRLMEMLNDFNISKDSRIQKAILKQRSIKSEEEINLIKRAQVLTDKTFDYILNNIKAGRTEMEVMLDMEFFMRKSGSEGVSFDFIVVSGKNSSLPHGVPTDKKIEEGDFVTMDFGAVAGGYRSDMTRTVAVGNVTDKQSFVYETVLRAQRKAFSFIKSGAICKDIDKAARDLINGEGFEGCFGHGLGHSVGIEIHENPAFNTRCETALESGMIMTIEPGIYIENEFGVRIEDMVLITDNGFENLTKSPKELLIL